MSWLKIAQSVVAGVLYFSLWSMLFYLFNVLRNGRLEKRLQKLIKSGGVKCENERVQVIVANYTGVEVVVRRVELVADTGRVIPLHYSGDIGEVTLDYGDVNEFTDKTRDWSDKRWAQAGMRDRGFVELPPETGGYWILRERDLGEEPLRFTACQSVVDYPTLFRTRGIVRTDSGPEVVSAIQDAYERYLRAREEDE